MPSATQAMTPQRFATWIGEQRAVYRKNGKPPLPLEQVLKQRLYAGMYVTDDTVMAVVAVWIGYENPKGLPGKDTWPHAKQLVTELLPISYEQQRPLLPARLHRQMAYFYSFGWPKEKQAEEYDKAVTFLTDLHLDVDKQRMESYLRMGQALLFAGKKQEAEAALSKVMDYHWPAIRDPEYAQIFRDFYIQAGKGLISCRRGNLEKLKYMGFHRSTEEELGPVLKQAIEEAQSR